MIVEVRESFFPRGEYGGQKRMLVRFLRAGIYLFVIFGSVDILV